MNQFDCKIIVIDDVESENHRVFEGDTFGQVIEREFENYHADWFLYKGVMCQENDISPKTVDEYNALRDQTGEFHLLICPKGQAVFVAIAIASLFVAAAVYFSIPEVPAFESSSAGNSQQKSPNNEFGNRQNKFRVGGTVPIILGRQRSIPDLLTTPMTVYQDHEQVEVFYSCIGYGQFAIDAENIRDGDTRLNQIENASVEIYGPNTSPKFGAPQLSIGDPIPENLKSTARSNSVNGQTLLAPNENTIYSNFQFRKNSTSGFYQIVDYEPSTDFTEIYEIGDSVELQNASVVHTTYTSNNFQGFNPSFNYETNSSGVISADIAFDVKVGIVNLTGTATLGAVSHDISGVYWIESEGFANGRSYVVLHDPAFINPAWNLLTGGNWDLTGSYVQLQSKSLNFNGTYKVSGVSERVLSLTALDGGDPRTVRQNWYYVGYYSSDFLPSTFDLTISDMIVDPVGENFAIGPFEILTPIDEIIVNVVAPNGLYKDSGKNKYALDVEFEISIMQYDEFDSVINTSVTTHFVEGSKTGRAPRAATVRVDGLNSTAVKSTVAITRISNLDKEFNGRVVEEIKWRDLYFRNDFEAQEFGNVTTAYVRLFATESATSVKNRQFNLDVTSKLPRWENGAFTSEHFETRNAADILCAISVDPTIGRLKTSEIDCDQIHTTIDEIESYFDTPEAVQFDYTFSNGNLSYEEIATTIAGAVFSKPYRLGAKVRLFFDRPRTFGVMLFNHRNTLVGSLERQFRFTVHNNYDGVEYEYKSLTGELETIYVPSKSETVNPERVDSVGVTSDAIALRHAWRAWNKRKYNRELVTFTATQESQIGKVGDMIYIADNIRPDIMDGDILEQSGLTLRLSQPATLMDGSKNYVIQLQLIDGTVQIIPIIKGSDDYHVILSYAPTIELVTSDSSYARTTYMIVEENGESSTKYLVVEKTPNSDTTIGFTAVKYQDEFYQND